MPDEVSKLVTYHVGGLVMLTILFNGLLTSKVREHTSFWGAADPGSD